MCLTYTFNPGAVIGLYLYAELYVGDINAVIGLYNFYGVIYKLSGSISFLGLNDYFENPFIKIKLYHNFLNLLNNLILNLLYCDVIFYDDLQDQNDLLFVFLFTLMLNIYD